MALVNYNTTLEYATNTVTLSLVDDLGLAEDFTGNNFTFNIERIDDSSVKYTQGCTVVGSQLTVVVTPPKGTLYAVGDDLYSFVNPKYEHIYSIKSDTQVYMAGKVNMVEVAG